MCVRKGTGQRTKTHIQKSILINEFYNPERILQEVIHTSKEWGGYYVAFGFPYFLSKKLFFSGNWFDFESFLILIIL